MTEDDDNQQADARLRRALRARQTADAQRVKRHRSGWTGEDAAIYCRISHVNDDDQTGVERQERICRELADRLGLVVTEDQVFVDNNRSAWQRKRKRPCLASEPAAGSQNGLVLVGAEGLHRPLTRVRQTAPSS